MNRREFLQASATATVLAAATGASGQTSAAPEPPGWYDRPMRWAQVAFVEDDPGNYDPKVLVRLFSPDPCRRGLP